MPRFTTQFGGLNTDVSPNHLRSGTADKALNVDVSKGQLQKRYGFEEWEDDVDGSSGGVVFVGFHRFGDGDAYVIAKMDDGDLYQRKVYPADAGSFTKITDNQTHSSSDLGWSFVWYDRWHYFDSGGGSRWNPDKNSGTAYKAGIPRCTTGATPSAAAAGTAKCAGMHGRYRVVPVYRFSETREEGQFAGPQAEAVQCALNDPDDSSGMAIDNWATIKGHAQVSAYEIDQVHFYDSKGHTEFVPRGAGYEAFPHKYYDGSIVQIADASASVNKGDHISDVTTRLTNAGGEPPCSVFGCYTGVRAIYGGIYESSVLVPGKIMFSIPDYPTSVPQKHEYTQGGDSKTFDPEPWEGLSLLPVTLTEILGTQSGLAMAFTDRAAWSIQSYGDGRLYVQKRFSGGGCVAHGAACAAGHHIHALGYNSWIVCSSGGVRDIAADHFRTTLSDIPGAYLASSRMAHYSHEHQVWCAVVKSGETVAQRILIWDPNSGLPDPHGRPVGALTIFEPAGLGSAGITAMCEMAYPGQDPCMLVATDAGKVMLYPDTTNISDNDGNTFVSQWRGYFGQERIDRAQIVEKLDVYAGSNVADNVDLKWRALSTGDLADDTDDYQQRTKPLKKDSEVEGVKTQLKDYHGSIFQVELYDSGVAEQWTIRGLAWELAATD